MPQSESGVAARACAEGGEGRGELRRVRDGWVRARPIGEADPRDLPSAAEIEAAQFLLSLHPEFARALLDGTRDDPAARETIALFVQLRPGLVLRVEPPALRLVGQE